MVNDPAELVAGETITLTVEATDADGIVGTGTVTVEVTEPVATEDTTPPVFSSLTTADAIENQNVLYTAVATDDSGLAVYGLDSTSTDAALLAIDATTGVVTLKTGDLDFDAADAKKIYSFSVTAADGATPANVTTQAVTITVTDDALDNGPTKVAVTAANDAATPVTDASLDDFIFEIAAGNYTYNISGFGDDDQLDFPVGNEASVSNSSFTDNAVDLTWSSAGQTVTIHLSGLATGLDAKLNFVSDFNLDTTFGADTII